MPSVQPFLEREENKRKGNIRTLPTTLGNVDGVTLDDRVDGEADVARLADGRRGVALAEFDRARNATADLQQSDVGRVEVKSPKITLRSREKNMKGRGTHVELVHLTLETVSWRTSIGAAKAATRDIASRIVKFIY